MSIKMKTAISMEISDFPAQHNNFPVVSEPVMSVTMVLVHKFLYIGMKCQ